MPTRTYPFSRDDVSATSRSFVDKCLTGLAVAKARRKRKKVQFASGELSLKFPEQLRPLSQGDVPLIFLCHNDGRFLRSFLAHYRKLGVSRFICVDDRSSDGSHEYLVAQPDVDLWTSPLRYKDARRGKAWREDLIALYGKDRWYLNVDSDEYLIYDDCYARPLTELIKQFDAVKIRRAPAPMIDMYPKSVDAAEFVGDDETVMPWHVADFFDIDGYRFFKNARFARIRGGVRGRLFETDLDLTKYPLSFWDAEASLGDNIHQPMPFDRNFAPISMVLLHFKFFSDYEQRTVAAVEEGQHFGGAREYRNMLDKISKTGPVQFFSEHSVRFDGPRQLVELGFMRSPWG